MKQAMCGLWYLEDPMLGWVTDFFLGYLTIRVPVHSTMQLALFGLIDKFALVVITGSVFLVAIN